MRGGGDALGGPDIDQRILVAARLVVVLAEGIAGEQDHQARVLDQVGLFGRAAVGGGGVVTGGQQQAGVFIGIVQAPDGRIRLERLDRGDRLEGASLGRLVLQIDQHTRQDGCQDQDDADQDDGDNVSFQIP